MIPTAVHEEGVMQKAAELQGHWAMVIGRTPSQWAGFPLSISNILVILISCGWQWIKFKQMLLWDLTGINDVLVASLRLLLFVQMILAWPLRHQDEWAPSYMRLVSHFRCWIIVCNLKQFSLGFAPTVAHHDMATLALHQCSRPDNFTKGSLTQHLCSQHPIRPWCNEVG